MSIEMSDVTEAPTNTGTTPETHRNSTPDTSTVKSLLTKQAALARHLEVSVKTVQLWVKMDRIPARHIIKIAQFYDVEVPLHLCQSDVKRGSERRIKPRETLPVCLEVQAGNLTIAEAAVKLGLHERAVQLILLHWGDQLPVLYKTLNDLDAGEITVAQAASTLGVCKNAVHDIRTKYGRAPERAQHHGGRHRRAVHAGGGGCQVWCGLAHHPSPDRQAVPGLRHDKADLVAQDPARSLRQRN